MHLLFKAGTLQLFRHLRQRNSVTHACPSPNSATSHVSALLTALLCESPALSSWWGLPWPTQPQPLACRLLLWPWTDLQIFDFYDQSLVFSTILWLLQRRDPSANFLHPLKCSIYYKLYVNRHSINIYWLTVKKQTTNIKNDARCVLTAMVYAFGKTDVFSKLVSHLITLSMQFICWYDGLCWSFLQSSQDSVGTLLFFNVWKVDEASAHLKQNERMCNWKHRMSKNWASTVRSGPWHVRIQ